MLDLTIVTSTIVLGTLTMLVIFQVALIASAPLGYIAWGGKYRVLPVALRIGSATSILIYIVMAALVSSKSGFWVLILDQTILAVGLWVCAIYLTFGVLLNAISRSRPERYVMTPVTLTLAVCFWIIIVG